MKAEYNGSKAEGSGDGCLGTALAIVLLGCFLMPGCNVGLNISRDGNGNVTSVVFGRFE